MATIKNLIIRIGVTDTDVTRGVNRVNNSLKSMAKEADKANSSSNRFSGTLSKGLTGGLSKIASTTLMAAKGLTVVAVAAGGLNTAIQAGTALAPLAGGLALLPAVALGAATAIGTLKIATSGMGDAFKVAMSSTATPKQLAASLKDLAPAARSTALELHKLRPELLGIKNAAQQALFAPLQGQLTAVVKTLAGPLRTGLAQVANQFGLAGRQVALFAQNAATVAVLRQAFITVGVSVRSLIPAIQPVLAGFRALAATGLSFLPQMANSVSTLATRFGLWLQQIVASGKATQWIQNALATLKQLFGVIGQVGGILKSVFSAVSAAGSNFLGVIGSALAQLNAFLKTAAGQSALKSIFQALGAIGTSLGPVIGALVTGLGTLAPPLAQLAQLVGPILTTAITALAPALGALAPGFQALFSGLGQAIQLVAPALVPLGKAIAAIGIAIGPILPVLGQLIGQLVANLAPILGQLFKALGPLVGAIVKLAGAFVPLIAPLAQIIVQLVTGLVPAITPLVPVFAQIVGVVGQLLVTALGKLVTAIVPLLPVISQAAVLLSQQFLTVLIALAPALLQMLDSLLPLLPSLLAMTPALVQLVVELTPLLVLVLRLSTAILNTLLPPVVAIIGWLLRFAASAVTTAGHVRDLVGQVAGLPGQIISAFSGAGKWLVNAGKNIIVGLWNGLASLGGWLYNKLVGLIKAIIPGPIKWALGISSPSKVTTQLGQYAGQGLANGILNTVSLVQRAAGTLAAAAIPTMAGAGSPGMSLGLATPSGVAAVTGSAAAGGASNATAIGAAVKAALVGIGVNMDGKPVGAIVSKHLGRDTDLRRRSG